MLGKFGLQSDLEMFCERNKAVLLHVAIDKPETSGKRYESWEVDAFCTMYARLRASERMHHEVISPYVPCRVYFDLESSVKMTVDEWLVKVNQVLDTVRGMVTVIGEPILWHSNRKWKKSTHVVYPDTWLSSMCSVLQVARQVHEVHSDMVDLAVYSELSYKQLRMPYSNKGWTEHEVVYLLQQTPLIEEIIIPEAVDVMLLKRSMLTVGAPEELVVVDNVVVPRVRLEYGTNAKEKRLIREWLVTRGAYNITETYSCEGAFDLQIKTVHCPVFMRHHKSNSTFLRVRILGNQVNGEFFCIDCRFSWKPTPSLTYVCHPELKWTTT